MFNVINEDANVITTNGGGTGSAFLGIEVAEAVETIGKVISRGKPLASQLQLAAGAEEAVLVPRLVTVRHPSSGDRLIKKRENRALSHLNVKWPSSG